VVLMEAKTGYGLSPAEETRHLQVLCKVIEASALPESLLPRIAPTLLGPHAASPDFRGLDAYIQALLETLPQCADMVKPLNERGLCQPLAADIFVERNHFTKEQGEKWLGSALGLGVDAHIHADEFSRSGGSELALALARRVEQTQVRKRRYGRVLSVNHCQYSTEADLTKLNVMGVAAVALPSTSFFSNIPYVEAMKWRASGVRIAIGTDFNPGSAPFNNIWFAAHLALTRCGFSLPEVLAGVTFNAAYALGAEDTHGRLEVGGLANLIAFEGTEPEDFFASPLGDHLRYVVRAP
jgi:imidazolonepropionase